MKVIESIPLRVDDTKAFTTLILDGCFPDTKFSSVRCGDETAKTTWLSGGRLDEVAVEGIHDFTGMEITFE